MWTADDGDRDVCAHHGWTCTVAKHPKLPGFTVALTKGATVLDYPGETFFDRGAAREAALERAELET